MRRPYLGVDAHGLGGVDELEVLGDAGGGERLAVGVTHGLDVERRGLRVVQVAHAEAARRAARGGTRACAAHARGAVGGGAGAGAGGARAAVGAVKLSGKVDERKTEEKKKVIFEIGYELIFA